MGLKLRMSHKDLLDMQNKRPSCSGYQEKTRCVGRRMLRMDKAGYINVVVPVFQKPGLHILNQEPAVGLSVLQLTGDCLQPEDHTLCKE